MDIGLAAKVGVAACAALRPRAPFNVPLNDPALFTDNPAGREFIAADDRKLTHVSARFLVASRILDGQLRRLAAGANAVPTMLLLAERDRIIRNGPTISWAERWSATPPAVDVFRGASHTLEFEPDTEHLETSLARMGRSFCRLLVTSANIARR